MDGMISFKTFFAPAPADILGNAAVSTLPVSSLTSNDVRNWSAPRWNFGFVKREIKFSGLNFNKLLQKPIPLDKFMNKFHKNPYFFILYNNFIIYS